MLAVLADSRGRPMGDVAEAAALPGLTLIRIVDRMVATELVDRRADTDDRAGSSSP